METNRIGAAVLTSKLKVSTGDPISLYVAVANLSMTDIIIHFPTAQQYDFALLDKSGKEYWRWSTGQDFSHTQPSSFTVKGGPQGGIHIDGVQLMAIPLPTVIEDYITLVGELPSTDLAFVGRVKIGTSGP